MSTVLSILNSQMVENIILFISAIIAIRTYIQDIQQKKILNTLNFISHFFEGGWVLIEDKKNWNEFFTNRLCRNACGEFSLTGKYSVKGGISIRIDKTEEDIKNIFSEGIDEIYGRSIINILNLLEFIAQKVNKNELDYNLIKIRLLRFYQLADYYNDILSEGEKVVYPEIKKLFKKLSKTFGKDEPLGNYSIFPIKL